MTSSKSKSLFHYTKSIDSLKGILRSGFYPNYSLEDLRWLHNTELHIAFPMVCFCDIPLSRVDKHVEFYGEYGIGLEQRWGVSKGLSPITYVSHESKNKRAFVLLGKVNREIGGDELNYAYYGFLTYTKPLRGKILRSGITHIRYFYKECEWRFIPKINECRSAFLPSKAYKDNKQLQLEQSILKEHPLNFLAKDVRHIILREESEIPEMYQFIKGLKKFSKADKMKLITRITTLRVIKEDY